MTLQQELAVIDSKIVAASLQRQVLALKQEVDQMKKSLAILMEKAQPEYCSGNLHSEAANLAVKIENDYDALKLATLVKNGGVED